MSIDPKNWEEIKKLLEEEKEVEDKRREIRYRGVNEELMREAEKLYELINTYIGKLDNGLYKLREGNLYYANTYVNASMGILACLLGKRDEAEKLYELINNEIGKLDSGLYKEEKDNSYAYTRSNALMGIFLVVLARGGIYEH
jgi:hypothetical protein